jgi:uncharacterized protein
LAARARVIIGNAGPRGKGVFAAGAISRSTVIGSFRGKPRWIWDIPEDVWPYTIQVDYDRYVVPRRNGTVWYLNHSCDPNCEITGRTIVARRDVRKGEELTFDYSCDVDWPGFAMPCSCGTPKCRKVIRAYRFLPGDLKARYGRHLAPFILREYSPKAAAGRSGAARRAAPRLEVTTTLAPTDYH